MHTPPGVGRRPALSLLLAGTLLGGLGACAPTTDRGDDAVIAGGLPTPAEQRTVVFQSDFGGGVMHGIARGVSRDIYIDDLSHSIPDFDIRAAARSLAGAAPYWPAGTVFVSVVDPGVGTPRKSVVLQTESGHYFVTPDNGTLELVADRLGIAAMREIDESVNRLAGSEWSHTFHGRDVYSYTGARLAAGVISFEQVGPLLESAVVRIGDPVARVEDGVAHGHVITNGARGFGNVGTNIDLDDFNLLGIEENVESARVTIRAGDTVAYDAVVPYVRTFGEVPLGEAMLYVNSRHFMGIALNQASFTAAHGIGTGPEWTLEIRKAPPPE